jgi:hypothetical protein
MFEFLRRSSGQGASGAIVRALQADSLAQLTDVSALTVVESPGSYSGRRVTFFHVLDPRRAASQAGGGGKRLTYRDVASHPDLVLRSGHLERDGTVVFYQVREAAEEGASAGTAPSEKAVPSRERANRSVHADDEHVIFPDRIPGAHGGAP